MLETGRAIKVGAPLSLAVLALLVAAVVGRSARKPAPHDIVLVVWDTCRGDRVSVNGYSRPTTPRLEELAARGVTFRRCYTPSPWTPPAHASLFTGLLPRHHGLREARGDRVRPGIPLLATTLSAAGYETVCVTTNPHLSTHSGLIEGFEKQFACWGEDRPRGTATDARIAVENWIAGRPSSPRERRPYVLFVNLMDTHLPYRVEDESVAAVRGDAEVSAAREAGLQVTNDLANAYQHDLVDLDAGILRGLNAAYDGAVRTDDRATGKILDALRAAGLLENAVVVVTSDHGENLGEHHLLNHMSSVYDPVLHVPLVIAWPGRLDGGRVEEAQVRLQDLYPTLLQAAGVAVPGGCGTDAVSLLETPLRSRSLIAEFDPTDDILPEVLERARGSLPQVTGEDLRRLSFAFLAVQDPADAPAPRKYIGTRRHLLWGAMRPEREELYDLRADPGEERNLLGPTAKAEDRAAADRLKKAGE